MEISIMRAAGLEDLEKHGFDCEKLVGEMTETVRKDIADRVGILGRYKEKEAAVTVTVKYLSDGIKKEPTDDQRSQLSALSKVHKRLMDKVKETTDFSETLAYGHLVGIVTDMMKEIENS